MHTNNGSSLLGSRLAALPAELRLLVIKYVIQIRCTISTWTLDVSTRQTAVVDLSRPVWACFAKTHARSYIVSLSNEKLEGPNKGMYQIIVFEPASAKTVDIIYLARDAWGVRNIKFSCSEDEPHVSGSPGVWWQILRISTKTGKLITQSDVLSPKAVTVMACTNDGTTV